MVSSLVKGLTLWKDDLEKGYMGWVFLEKLARDRREEAARWEGWLPIPINAPNLSEP